MTAQSLNAPLRSLAIALVTAVGVAACSGTPTSSPSPTAPTAGAAVAAGAGNATSGLMGDPVPPDECPAIIKTTEEPGPDPCDPPATGRFTGGGFQIGEVRVTRGFTIHCDNRLTNNLEVNWGGGNNFHMDRNALTGVVCTRPDDPTPPASPVSRISATSTGTCNGAPATISFILEDHGEPGRNDRAELLISGACTLNLLLATLDGGNIQAHYDQPHRRN